MHYLFIVRHAQTHHIQEDTPDKERTLKPEGILQAKQVGKFLSDANFNINLIFSSDAERAKTTACLIAESIHYPVHQIRHEEIIYSGNLNDLLIKLKKVPDTITTVMMVGHYPTIVELYNYLCSDQKTGISTCELNLIRIHHNWASLSRGCGSHQLNYQPFL